MKVYVMTHKKFEPPMGDIYVPLHVGKALATDLGYLGDDTGENISDLNPYFGELTGLYWVWQNDQDSEYIGICHYRRFFGLEDGSIMDNESLLALLSDYDCITSEVANENKSNFDVYKEAHPIEDLMVVRDSLESLYPEFLDTFDSVLKDNKHCFGNICVMPHSMYNEYCSWLFSTLFDASDSIDLGGRDLYQQRAYGFLSEFLLEVYVRHMKYSVGRIQIVYTDEKAETRELRLAVDSLIQQGQYQEARKLFEGILKARPDVALPMSDVLRRVPIIDFITGALVLEEKAGYNELCKVSDNLSGLIEYYQTLYRAFLNQETKDIEYLKENPPSPVLSAMMIKKDISYFIKLPALIEQNVDKVLKSIYDFKLYQSYLDYKKLY